MDKTMVAQAVDLLVSPQVSYDQKSKAWKQLKDAGKLDQAIDDVKNLVDHNTLDTNLRDAISADLRDLRVLKAEHDH